MKSKESIFKSKLAWAVIAELAILAVAGILRPDFFRIEYNATTGMFYGSIVDIINRSSEITIIAMGMTMVIALGGTDISVGALVAVAGAFALKLLRWDVTEYPTPGDYTVYPFVLVILVPLAVCTLMGLFNGILIGKFKLEPIIATLILMVAGRGIAQIATNGKQFTTGYTPFRFIGQGSLFGLPFPIILAVVICTTVMIFVRRTAFGTFVESVGINPSASRVTGLKSSKIIIIVYTRLPFRRGRPDLLQPYFLLRLQQRGRELRDGCHPGGGAGRNQHDRRKIFADRHHYRFTHYPHHYHFGVLFRHHFRIHHGF